MKHIHKKIAIVIHSLGKGGEEKASANLSILLSGLGFEIHLISALNYVDYEYKGQLLNLGFLKDKDDSFFARLIRFLVFYRYLKSERFDFIIDSRARPIFFKQLLINKILYAHQKVIYVVHSYRLKNYIPKSRFLAKVLYKNAFQLVAVSQEIKKLKYTDRLKIIEVLVEVVYADGKMDEFEDNLIRRVCGLVYVENADVGTIKENIKKKLTL